MPLLPSGSKQVRSGSSGKDRQNGCADPLEQTKRFFQHLNQSPIVRITSFDTAIDEHTNLVMQLCRDWPSVDEDDCIAFLEKISASARIYNHPASLTMHCLQGEGRRWQRKYTCCSLWSCLLHIKSYLTNIYPTMTMLHKRNRKEYIGRGQMKENGCYSVEAAPRCPELKLSINRTHFRSSGTVVPPDVTQTTLEPRLWSAIISDTEIDATHQNGFLVSQILSIEWLQRISNQLCNSNMLRYLQTTQSGYLVCINPKVLTHGLCV